MTAGTGASGGRRKPAVPPVRRARPTRPDVIETPQGVRLRQLTEPDQLRAMAHPRRMEIIDLLMAHGPMTATQCADRLSDSAASCSYHLRQLARYGFVEEAPGGTGRNRPWRWVPIGNRIDPGTTPAQQAAADEVLSVIDARNIDRIRRYRATSRREPWAEDAHGSDWLVHLTREEMTTLGEQINALIAPLQQRTFDGNIPDGARLVDVLNYVLPRPVDDRAGGHDA